MQEVGVPHPSEAGIQQCPSCLVMETRGETEEIEADNVSPGDHQRLRLCWGTPWASCKSLHGTHRDGGCSWMTYAPLGANGIVDESVLESFTLNNCIL